MKLKIIIFCTTFQFFLLSLSIYCQDNENSSLFLSNEKLELLGDGFVFTQGHVADKKGNVFFTTQPLNKIITTMDSVYGWKMNIKAFTN